MLIVGSADSCVVWAGGENNISLMGFEIVREKIINVNISKNGEIAAFANDLKLRCSLKRLRQ